MSPLLRLYLGFSRFSDPIWRAIIRRRLRRGKENGARLPEKFGVYEKQRPNGTIIWINALGIGECLAVIPLIEHVLSALPEASVVLSSSTRSSAVALEKAQLPDRCVHVMLPIDTQKVTRRFLDHWVPDLAIFAELDFWPRLMTETHRRKIPMALVNSRMMKANFQSRKRMSGLMRDIFGYFDFIGVQDVSVVHALVFKGVGPKGGKMER
ncbi:MAG: hypothetical protein GKR98_02550 [Boseongicola sp.]|nr:MAG: hypothetical protein GKR98_02550 [Boseongicola sp.]